MGDALRQSEEKYRLMFEHSPLGVFYFNNKGIITDCNEKFAKTIGSSREVLIGLDTLRLPDVKITAAIQGALEGKLTTYEGNYKSLTANKITPVRVTIVPIVSEDKLIEGGTSIVEDISERKKMEELIFNEKERLKMTILSVGDGVISTDNRGRILLLNKIAEQLTGWTQQDAIGQPLDKVFNVINEFTREKYENRYSKLLGINNNREFVDNVILISKEGIEYPIEHSSAPIKDEDNNINGVVYVFKDFTEKKERQDKVEYLSFHDQLTGLYNRRFFEEELIRLDTERNLPLTLVMIDVNGLKLANDAFGHLVGDLILKKVAEIIQKQFRSDDIVARIGGDEFVVILPNTSFDEARLIVSRMDTIISNEKVDSINLSIACGWETKHRHDEKVVTVFKKAEDNMYRQKLSEHTSLRYKTLDIILNTLYEKNNIEESHLKSVSQLCVELGGALKLTNEQISELKSIGLMHDIGKIAIDEKILTETKSLSESDWIEIRRHSEIGYRILSSINEYAVLAGYVLAHHERWDGTGYPKGLKGEEIPWQSRIVAVADAYDAMVSKRHYKEALSKKDAMEEIKRNAGTQFDPEIAKVFIESGLGEEQS
nr:diguanylate cyclase [Alkalibaculum sporogenes]